MTDLICFWCQSVQGTIEITPEQAKGREIPKAMIGGYEPCKECAARIGDGIAIIEMSLEPTSDEQPSVAVDGKDCFPTGRYLVLDEKNVFDIFTKKAGDEVLKQRRALVPVELFNLLAGDIDAKEETQH